MAAMAIGFACSRGAQLAPVRAWALGLPRHGGLLHRARTLPGHRRHARPAGYGPVSSSDQQACPRPRPPGRR
jgi:hypothetical protein